MQIELPERYDKQQILFSDPLPRDQLISKSLEIIPGKIRIHRNMKKWGLANYQKIDEDTIYCKFMVTPIGVGIGKESEPGVLEKSEDLRFSTDVVCYLPFQVIAVLPGTLISRYISTAKSFSIIFQELFSDAIKALKQEDNYRVEVEPIAQKGSFIEWVDWIDILERIRVIYSGPNFPGTNSSTVDQIKESARQIQKLSKADSTSHTINRPNFSRDQILELDEAVSERRLKFTAAGKKDNLTVPWSSSNKPVPEKVPMELEQEEYSTPIILGKKVRDTIINYFAGRKQIE